MSAPSEAGLKKPGARAINRAKIVDENFESFLAAWDPSQSSPVSQDDILRRGCPLTGRELLEIFEYQMLSRHLDYAAREMRSRNESFYTIGSSGHEGNAVLGCVTRPTDPAFLHYRSGGFMMARLSRQGGSDPVFDTALALSASREDPIAGGRHKVWGNHAAWVLPQTSTIASHLPKAVGTAIALEQARRLRRDLPVPADSIIVCSFGDASTNHSVALGAFNAAEWTAYQRLPVPILFVCEDNRLGISVKTPASWIETSFGDRKSLRYMACDGLDVVETDRVVREAVDFCRTHRAPVFLHMKLVRLLGHAGTDVETEYRTLDEIEATETQDPLLNTAATVLRYGLKTADEVRDWYESLRDRVMKAAAKAAKRPQLKNADDVMKPLAPLHSERVNKEAVRKAPKTHRVAVFGGAARLPEKAPPRHMAILINRALHDLMIKYPEMTVFGEDVAQKGGVYTVTTGLATTFKGNRVFNTLLDETTILGMAQGAGYMGLLPVPEIQYLAYFHNACDQIRGEAASLQFFSNGQFANPMVMRIASFGYQKGFGGHFHNDNSFTALRDVPGLVIAAPARGDDAAMMLRTAMAMAKVDGRVIAFLEPIALYMTKDLYESRDREWSFEYPAPETAIPFGEPRIYEPEAQDLLIITFGNGVPMTLRAGRRIRHERNARTRIMDLRWLKPLNREAIVEHARAIGRVLVVDEGRRTGGLSEELFTLLDESLGNSITKSRVVGHDSYIPLGPAANFVLPSEDDILAAAHELLDT